MKIMLVLPVALLTACAPMVTDYPQPASRTEANVAVNKCLHFGECQRVDGAALELAARLTATLFLDDTAFQPFSSRAGPAAAGMKTTSGPT